MIRFENVSKNYRENAVLKNISLEIPAGQLVVIIGESGCGKTTLLKMINRLIHPTYGSIYINGTDIHETDVIALRRKIGYVIQQTGLFPHMTVRENIEIIPRVMRINKAKILEKTLALMEMINLPPEEYLNRYPIELSGGQQQRIGVARSFANDPDIVLMDEPFSALDPISRSDLQDELVSLHAKLKKTIVFVTHDMDEAVKIAEKICIMKDGKILQFDTPENILKNPADDFVSSFVGKNRIWASPEFIKITDIMIETPVTCSNELPLLRCIERMRHEKVDSLLVVDRKTGILEGILTARSARNAPDKSTAAGSVMETVFPVLNPQQNILDALKVVNERNIPAVPVTDETNHLKGLVTRSGLLTAMSQQYLELEI